MNESDKADQAALMRWLVERADRRQSEAAMEVSALTARELRRFARAVAAVKLLEKGKP